MGLPIPENRKTAAYEHVKQMMPGRSPRLWMSIVDTAAYYLEKDEPYKVIAAIESLNESLNELDLVGRYRLMAVLLTDEKSKKHE